MNVYSHSLEPDGIRILEFLNERKQLKLLVSAKPDICPEFVVQRTKGRLRYLLRKSDGAMLSRKVSLRSIGYNKKQEVENFISNQVQEARFVDPRFEEILGHCTSDEPATDLKSPSMNRRGAYWYDLHLVLVSRSRQKISSHRDFDLIDHSLRECALVNGLTMSSRSLMPDHLHAALRGNTSMSPLEISVEIMNSTSKAVGRSHWQDGFYVGTFGEYDIEAIRKIIAKSK